MYNLEMIRRLLNSRNIQLSSQIHYQYKIQIPLISLRLAVEDRNCIKDRFHVTFITDLAPLFPTFLHGGPTIVPLRLRVPCSLSECTCCTREPPFHKVYILAVLGTQTLLKVYLLYHPCKICTCCTMNTNLVQRVLGAHNVPPFHQVYQNT